MEPLKIAIVDSNEESCKRLEDKLSEKGGALTGFGIIYIKISYSQERGAEKEVQTSELLKNDPDLIILNHSLSKKYGLKIAKEIRQRNNFIPIILTSKTSDPITTNTLAKIINDYSSMGLIDQSWEKTATQALIKDKLRRPLDVAVLGLGMLGQAFLRGFLKSNYIGKVKGLSERRKPGSEPVIDYERIYKLVGAEKPDKGTHHRLNFFDTLEETINGTDCTIISTSAVHGPSIEKIAKTKDRHDLIDVEGAKIMKYAHKMRRARYKGLVINMTNPVGANLALAKYMGLKSDQLTSSIDVDDARFLEAIRAKLGSDYKAFKEFSYQLVGEHGKVRFAELTSPKTTKDLETIREVVNDKLIAEALKRASEMGAEQMESASHFKTAYDQAPEEATKLLINLANFSTGPKSSYYCYKTFEKGGGFVALPCKISYFPNVRIRPDEDRIRNIQNGAMKDIKDIISLQSLYVKNFLTGGKHGRKN